MSTQQMGLLAVAMTPHPVDEESFNARYNSERIPAWQAAVETPWSDRVRPLIRNRLSACSA